MNSYISLILEAEGAKERLRRLFQSAPEPENPGSARLCRSEELTLIVERSSEEVVHGEFDASDRVRLSLERTKLIPTVEEEAAVAKELRQRPICAAAFITSLGYFLEHLYA